MKFDTSGMALDRAYPDNAPEVIKLDVSGMFPLVMNV